MSYGRSRAPHPGVLAMSCIVTASILAINSVSCRRKESPPPASNTVAFRVGTLDATNFRRLVVVQDRLWVTTNDGVAVIDPVEEKWTKLGLGTANLADASVVPCGSDVWLLLRNDVVLVDLQKKTFQSGEGRQGLPDLSTITNFFCGVGALWLFARQDGSLYRVPVSQSTTTRYETRRPLARGPLYFEYAQALQNGVYLLTHEASQTHEFVRFDPNTSALDRVQLPGGALALALVRTDDGLLARTRDSTAFLLKAEGQPWVPVPQRHGGLEPVLAEGSGVAWVGASYDVSPGSYFVLRYIRDTKEPRDLLILPWDPPSVSQYSAVQYLGVLWAVSGTRVLRIDPNVDEFVSYDLTDSTGLLRKKTSSLAKRAGGLWYFERDTLLPPFSGSPEPVPEAVPDSEPQSPKSADLQ